MEEVLTELQNAYYETIKELTEGEIVKGKVIGSTTRDVIVDVGYKSEGMIPREEFRGSSIDELGEIDVYVENVEDEEGKIVLSFKKANETKGWQTLVDTYKEKDLVEGTITRRVKGGYMVSTFGVEGFLPQSLASFRNMSPNEIEGNKYYFQIVKMNKAKGNFILSRKDAVRIEREIQRKKIWEELKAGTEVKGKVKSITNFGSFVDLGGVDGLLHIADMSWKRSRILQRLLRLAMRYRLLFWLLTERKEKCLWG
ncbi:MAG: S1 RNA-binding domain-containing protein [Candidatus Omnitrophota bacterium]